MNKLSSQDRSNLIKLASSLPKSSEERRAILAGLRAHPTRAVEAAGKLQSLLKSKKVWVEDGEYVGKSKDGTEVTLGSVGDERTVERYLKDHPTPDTW